MNFSNSNGNFGSNPDNMDRNQPPAPRDDAGSHEPVSPPLPRLENRDMNDVDTVETSEPIVPRLPRL